MFSHEMMDLVKIDGKARGIIARNHVTGKLERFSAHAVVIASVDMETFFIYQQMQWEVMSPRHGKFIKKEPTLLIHVLLKFIQHVSQYQVIISQN